MKPLSCNTDKLLSVITAILTILPLMMLTSCEADQQQSGPSPGEIRARAERAFKAQQWKQVISLIEDFSSTSQRSASAEALFKAASRENAYADLYITLTDQLHQGKYGQAWAIYQKIPMDSYTFVSARRSLMAHITPLAEALITAGRAVAGTGDTVVANGLFRQAKLLVPSMALVEAAEEESTPPPSRRRSWKRQAPSAEECAWDSYLKGELKAAILCLEQAVVLGSQTSPRGAQGRLELYRLLAENRDQARQYLDQGQTRPAFSLLTSAGREALELDKRRRSPITRQIYGQVAALALTLGDHELARGTSDGIRDARKIFEEGAAVASQHKALRVRLKTLDQVNAAGCYRPIYARFKASPTTIDRNAEGSRLEQCLDMAPRGYEYHLKIQTLMKELRG